MIEKPTHDGTPVATRLFHVSPEYLRQLADRMELQVKDGIDKKHKVVYFFAPDIGFVYERDIAVN